MKNRILSLLLTFMLCISAFVGVTVAVETASPTAAAATPGNTAGTLQELKDAISAAPTNGTETAIEITANIQLDGELTIAVGKNIKMFSTAARTISAANNTRLFTVNGNFTLENYITLKGTGTVYGNGGGVGVDNGYFTMNGGEIINGTANFGGGVAVFGTFTMNGGKISGNTAIANTGDNGQSWYGGYGGGVYVNNTGVFTMTGGEISNNSATCPGNHVPGIYGMIGGGGVFVSTYFGDVGFTFDSYSNVNIGPTAVFKGNTADGSSRVYNGTPNVSTYIKTTNSSIAGLHPLNNWDINYSGGTPYDPSADDKLNNIINNPGGSSANEILDAIKDIDFEEASPDKIKEVEDIYKSKTGITVNVQVAPNTHGNFHNNVRVVGAAFNAPPGQSVSLQFTKPDKDAEFDTSKYKANNAVQVSIDLVGVGDSSSLVVPIIITVPVPSGVSPKDFFILHYKKDGSYEVIIPTLNGDGTCSFIVTGFSTFVFVNSVEPDDGTSPTYPPYRPGGSSGSSGGGGGGSSTSAQIVLKPLTTADVTSALKNAQTIGGILSPTFKNISTVSKSVFSDIARLAGRRVVEARFDSMNGGAVDVRLYIDPSAVTKDLNVSASTSNQAAKSTKAKFEKTFSNKIAVISFGQKGDFGTTINVAAKVDLTGFDTDNLNFYSYDNATNKYKRIATPKYSIDKNGYLKFSTELVGDIIITDKPLEKK